VNVTAETIVGRDAELLRIHAFFDEGGALLLEGEPGIGKTTLWRAALDRAPAESYRILEARPSESEARLSYAALADLLSNALDDVSAHLRDPQLRALEVALLRSSEGKADPRTIATGLLSVIEALAAESGVLIAVDDVQWLDPPSARALAFAARRLPSRARLLATRRADDPATPAPLGLPDEQVERVWVGALSVAALHHLLASKLDSVPSRPVLLRIADASGGNPFYALEIAKSLSDDPAHPLGRPLPVPERLRQLADARLGALSTSARRAVAAASALSRPTPELVVKAVGTKGAAALVEAEDRGMVTLHGDRVRFTHPLLASAVHGALEPGERRRLHAQLARIVADPEERARHLAQSTIQPQEATAADVEDAARGASRRGAQETAAELYEAAARLTPAGDTDAGSRRLLGEATALLASGALADARVAADSALEIAAEGAALAETLFLLAQIDWLEWAPSAMRRLEEALDHAGSDRRLQARIHGKMAALALDDQRFAVEHADAAISLLDPDEDPGLLAYVLLYRLFFGVQVGLGMQPGLLERALELEERAGADWERSSIVLIWHRCLDDIDAARARFAVEEQWYRERGEEGWRAEKAAQLAFAELRAGNWDVAEAVVTESCSTLQQLGGSGAWVAPFMIRALVSAHRGHADDARETLKPIIENLEGEGAIWFAAIGLSMLGFAELAAGDAAAATTAFERREHHLRALGVVVPLDGHADADRVEALVAVGDLEQAGSALELLELRGRSMPRLWVDVTLPRARALVLAARGDLASALDTLTKLDADRAARLPFELARTLLVRGRIERRLKKKRAAGESLRQALATFEEVGAPAWAEQARQELARVGLRAASDDLTETERVIAELAATGLTNREVAKAAFVSPKTVEANLARVYRKLGIASRAELGARMSARS
jgi:DNA-binding CsgD family transcriptional regulator